MHGLEGTFEIYSGMSSVGRAELGGRTEGRKPTHGTEGRTATKAAFLFSIPGLAPRVPSALCAQLMHFSSKAGNFHSLVMTWEM